MHINYILIAVGVLVGIGLVAIVLENYIDYVASKCDKALKNTKKKNKTDIMGFK